MIHHQFHNITLNVTVDPECGSDATDVFEHRLGYCEFDLPAKEFTRFMQEDWEGYEHPCKRRLDEWEPGQGLCCSHYPDVFISFVNWAISDKTPVEIDITVQHMFWLLHDLIHADDGDVINCEGHIAAATEARKLKEAEEQCREEYGYGFPDEWKEALCESFYNRFKESIHTYTGDTFEVPEPEFEEYE